MATGHVLPGYGQPVTNLRRAKSAIPLDSTKLTEYAKNIPPPDYRELREIYDNARHSWLTPSTYATTYNNHFSGRPLDEPTRSRPTSPTRKNKPHPPLVFLTNRLHHIDGYQLPDATLGKNVYRVDGIVNDEEYIRRRMLREKYMPRPHTAAIAQYRDDGMKQMFPATEAQAASAWMKIANDKDQHKLLNVMNEERTKQFHEQQKLERLEDAIGDAAPDRGPPMPHPMPSLHRWMKYAGPNEYENVNRFLNAMRDMPPQSPRRTQSAAASVQGRRYKDMNTMRQARYPSKPARGDFLMHPDWPPNIPHHYVP